MTRHRHGLDLNIPMMHSMEDSRTSFEESLKSGDIIYGIPEHFALPPPDGSLLTVPDKASTHYLVDPRTCERQQ